MKGLVTVASGEIAQVLFTDGDLPEVGCYYFLEKSEPRTGNQNRAFHALVMEYWRSGMHSYDCKSYIDFRNNIKKYLGEGFESYVYVDYMTRDYLFMADCAKKRRSTPVDY